MEYLRTASFAGLFTTAFAVGAASQLALSIAGVLLALTSPGMFNMNGIAATTPIQAFGPLIFLLVAGLFFNAGFSALGSACWLLVRRWFPRARDT